MLFIRLMLAYCLTWIPLLILAIVQDVAYGHDLKVPFLYDFSIHVRFLFAMPIFLFAEKLLAPHVSRMVKEFVNQKVIRESQEKQYLAVVLQFERLNDSVIADVVIIAIVSAAALAGFYGKLASAPVSWQQVQTGNIVQNSAAGWWFVHIAVPLWQFLMLRWIWSVLIYCKFLYQLARMDLNLVPTHPDRVGGLGFLSLGQVWFLPFIFAMSSVLSSTIGMQTILGEIKRDQLISEIVMFIVIMLLLIIAPLAVFAPKLLKTRRNGLFEYGRLATDYVNSFNSKWLNRKSISQQLLGTSDIQSLADLANSFRIIQEMQIVPFTRSFFIITLATIIGPMMPLVLTVYSPQAVLQIVKNVIIP